MLVLYRRVRKIPGTGQKKTGKKMKQNETCPRKVGRSNPCEAYIRLSRASRREATQVSFYAPAKQQGSDYRDAFVGEREY